MYLSPDLGIFVPSIDYCDYAVSPQHTHPGYSFIYNFNGLTRVKVKQDIQQSPFQNKANICAFGPEIPHEEIMEDQFKTYFAVFIDKNFYENQMNQYKNIKNIIFQGDYFPANVIILTSVLDKPHLKKLKQVDLNPV